MKHYSKERKEAVLKKMATQWVLLQLVFYQSAQPVIELAHIRRLGAQPDASVLTGDEHQL